MPIQPNFLERTAFFTLNAAPAPMLDLAGALAFQAVNTAVRLNLFTTLQERPSTPTELAQSLNCQERGLEKLLAARWRFLTRWRASSLAQPPTASSS